MKEKISTSAVSIGEQYWLAGLAAIFLKCEQYTLLATRSFFKNFRVGFEQDKKIRVRFEYRVLVGPCLSYILLVECFMLPPVSAQLVVCDRLSLFSFWVYLVFQCQFAKLKKVLHRGLISPARGLPHAQKIWREMAALFQGV